MILAAILMTAFTLGGTILFGAALVHWAPDTDPRDATDHDSDSDASLRCDQ